MPDLITLPDADTMLARLRKVTDSDHVVKGLFPKLTAYAGESKYREGIELLVELAIYDYAQEMPPAVAAVLSFQAPRFVAALAGDDD